MAVQLQSVRTRLIAAFAGIIALSLAGVAAGVFAFMGARGALDVVVEETAPRTAAAQALNAASSAIAGELAAFSRSRDAVDMQVSASRLDSLMEDAATAVAGLRDSGMAPARVAELEQALSGVKDSVEAAAGPVEAKLTATEVREAGMRGALRDRAEASEALEAALDETTDPADIETLLRANMALNLAVARYAELSGASTQDEVDAAREAFDFAADELSINLAILGGVVTDAIRTPSERLLERAEGDQGLFALRRAELARISEVDLLVEEARIMDAALAQLVDATRVAALEDQAGASASGQAAIAAGQITMLVFALLSIAAGVAIIWLYVSRNLLARLTGLTHAMKSLAGGTIGEKLASDGSDELSDMTRAVNVFRDNAIERRRLEAERGEDEAARTERTRAIEALIASFEDVSSRALSKVGDAAREMDSAALALDQSSRGASETTAQVNASSARAAENVDTVAAAAEEMTSCIAEIAQQIARSTEIAQDASDQVQQTNGDVAALNDAAARIGDIVNLINAIAEQTNLLALNATIEAARAGEAGKGFAVVASEVKALAEQTSKATSSISEQIGGIQGATGKAVEAMGSISQVIGEMNTIASAIAAAMEEQRAAASEITRAAQEAATGTRDVSGSIAKVDAAASETGQCAAQVSTASGALNTEADGLEKAVKQFLAGVRAA
ncbi:MAG: HAMP domain-containing methyl-accepting chemotaxis protein [Oceanicaulis sp.]